MVVSSRRCQWSLATGRRAIQPPSGGCGEDIATVGGVLGGNVACFYLNLACFENIHRDYGYTWRVLCYYSEIVTLLIYDTNTYMGTNNFNLLQQ